MSKREEPRFHQMCASSILPQSGASSSHRPGRKGWSTRRLTSLIGRGRSYPQVHSSKSIVKSKSRRIRKQNLNLNINVDSLKSRGSPSDISSLRNQTASIPSSSASCPRYQRSSDHSNVEETPHCAPSSSSSSKKRKRKSSRSEVPATLTSFDPSLLGSSSSPAPDLEQAPSRLREVTSKTAKQKHREKGHKKRQKANKKAKAEEERLVLENEARRKEDETLGPRRFLVRLPLSRVSDLAGRSICKNFRKADLDLNDIRTVDEETARSSTAAGRVLDCLQRPLYFEAECEGRLTALKAKLNDAPVCSKLKICRQETPQSSIRILSSAVIDAIEQVLRESGPPHELESSQNSEEKIKSLFKPVLRSLGLDNVLVTTGFTWRESIGLRSTIDHGTHVYSPRSDVAIVQVQNKKEAKILIIFEAYSRLGQSVKTPDENRADRVRLLIQGSYITRRDAQPAVVFYLTHDKNMETILVFSTDEESGKTSYLYHAKKLPFYSESTWIDLTCQVVNLIQDRI